MKKIALLSLVTSLVAGAFVAGVAVGKGEPAPKAKFVAAEEVKWDDVGGPKLGLLTGDYKKGAYGALMKIPAGFTSPLHSHTGTYEAIQISGTSSHWLKGEDGTKAKKMTPGSYWTITGKAEHVSACAPGADCVLFVWQKTKFDFVPGKEAAGAGSAAKAGAGAGSAAVKVDAKAGAGAGSAAVKVDAKAGAGAGTGSAAVKAGAGAGAGTGSATKK